MALARSHLERLAAAGLLVSEQLPAIAVCPGGFKIHKARRDGLLVCGSDLWAGDVAVLPAGVQEVTEATDLGARVRRTFAGVPHPLFVVDGPGLWIHEEGGQWQVYDGDVCYPGGIHPSFRWVFDTPEAAMEAILSFFRRQPERSGRAPDSESSGVE